MNPPDMVALAIRDITLPIITIAMDYGFSSRSALTSAFGNAYGCTPGTYRRNPITIPIQCRKVRKMNQ